MQEVLHVVHTEPILKTAQQCRKSKPTGKKSWNKILMFPRQLGLRIFEVLHQVAELLYTVCFCWKVFY